MDLSLDLLSEFAKVATEKESRDSSITYMNGKIVLSNGIKYVQFDGSDELTPVESFLVGVSEGNRVAVQIKNHSVIVTGNISDPSANVTTVGDLSNKIDEFGQIVADVVTTDDLEAINANIENLVADNVIIKGDLEASKADIGELEADNVIINEKLTAQEAEIDKLDTEKLDAEIADIKYATIENLDATNADIHNLEADYGAFKNLTAENFYAIEGEFGQLDAKYANIDFANIGSAAIENFFSKSGMIGDLVVGDGTVTGTLVGVTIKGDLIEGGTVVADKLVVQGEDGLYYKLNVEGEKVSSEQTEYNSLNGSIITAKSVTAEKISVNDLVAFGATIGGFHITDSSLYSGVKTSVDNGTRGTYMNSDGEFAIGDNSNFLKFFKDEEGNYKLAISANTISMGASSNLEDSIVKQTEEYYQSTSPTELVDGSWSDTAPVWTQGTFIWRRTLITYLDGRTDYIPSQNGVCISGNTGAQGPAGADGEKGDKGDPGDPGPAGENGADGADGKGVKLTDVSYQAGSSQTSAPTGTWLPTVPKLTTELPYLWTRTVITYTDGTSSTSYSVSSTLDSVEVGGTNILLKTKTFEYSSSKSIDGALMDTTATIVEETYKSLSVRKKENVSTISRTSTYAEYYTNDFEYGDIYTLSFYAKGTVDYFSVFSHGNPSTTGIYVRSRRLSSSQNHEPSFFGDGYTKFSCTEDWCRYWVVYELFSSGDKSSGKRWLVRNDGNTVENGTFYICGMKLEKGNKATDWSPAPEDVDEGINDAQNTADNAQNAATDAINKVTSAQLDIDGIKGTISTLVTDENGESLMTQTGSGWTFNIGGIQSSINDALEGVSSVEGSLNEANQVINSTKDLVDDISEKTAYITMSTDEDGDPCIELGREDSEFKVRITNTSIDFMQGANKIAYITNQTLYIQSSVVTDEFKIGAGSGYIWKRRANNHLGLRYVTG